MPKLTQKDYKDKDIRTKLIWFLSKRSHQAISEEVLLGSYRADLFIANSFHMVAYEIKSFKDDVKRFFTDQLPKFLFATERLFTKIVLVVPEIHLDKVKSLAQEYKNIPYTLGLISYNDRLTLTRQPNVYVGTSGILNPSGEFIEVPEGLK